MICPMCLEEVEGFEAAKATDSSMVPRCPKCGGDVPTVYINGYAEHPLAVFSLIGFRSHGKSVFLSSLFHEMDSAAVSNPAKEWPEFSYSAVDPDVMLHVREMQRKLENREMPPPTDTAFFKPAILRMKQVPRFGSCHLLAYDTSGESLLAVDQMKSFIGYVSRVPTVLLLVSWMIRDAAEQPAHHLDELLTIYRQAVLDLGGDPKSQNLLVVLTKGDRLLDEPDIPESIQRFLTPEPHADGDERPHEPGDDEHFERLDMLSQEIELWLEGQRKFGNFVRQAPGEFRRVEYCIVSATGSEPESGKLVCDVAPCGVLSALLWTLKLQFDGQAEEQRHKAVVERYVHILNAAPVVEHFQKHKAEKERQRALRKLSQGRGRTLLARRLVNSYRAAHT